MKYPRQPAGLWVSLACLCLLAIALSACTQAGKLAEFTAGDVTTAQTIATAGGDKNGVLCWGSVLPIAQAVQGGGTVGIAAATEIMRVAQIQMQGPCASIILPVVIKLAPLLGGLGAIQALPMLAPLL